MLNKQKKYKTQNNKKTEIFSLYIMKKYQSTTIMISPRKIAFVGNPGVGKTSLISRIVQNRIQRFYVPTQGVVETKFDEYTYLYDISGQIFNIFDVPQLKRMLSRLEINYIVFVYDSTDMVSYEQLEFIKDRLEDIQSIVVSNKIDMLLHRRKIEDNNRYNVCARDGRIGILDTL